MALPRFVGRGLAPKEVTNRLIAGGRNEETSQDVTTTLNYLLKTLGVFGTCMAATTPCSS